MQSIFSGVYIVAKFFLSKAPDGQMNCISRTLGKFSIVDHDHKSKVQAKDIWLCQIVKEIHPGQNKGAFILRPVEKIDPENIRKIIPGFYNIQTINRAAIITPNTDPNDFWLLSKATRQIFSKKYYAVVVPIQYQED